LYPYIVTVRFERAPVNPETEIVEGYGLEIPFGDVVLARSVIVMLPEFEKVTGGATP
jgi:hypothetical protein